MSGPLSISPELEKADPHFATLVRSFNTLRTVCDELIVSLREARAEADALRATLKAKQQP